jgi:drug/metabolite transporter (DMT)-like permease
MRAPAPHTADDATRSELWRASLRLLLMCLVLGLLVVPLVRQLPLGQTSRIGLFAWLLVVLAVYWLYAGLGYQALLLLQLVIFSAAAVLLTTKVALVIVGIERLTILRITARWLIIAGAGLAVINLGSMLLALTRRRRPG